MITKNLKLDTIPVELRRILGPDVEIELMGCDGDSAKSVLIKTPRGNISFNEGYSRIYVGVTPRVTKWKVTFAVADTAMSKDFDSEEDAKTFVGKLESTQAEAAKIEAFTV